MTEPEQARFFNVRAFTTGNEGGNPAGVVLHADALTQQQKQQIAKWAALSETTFVSASGKAAVKLEYFTPSRQIAHCGHATLAAFKVLWQLGELEQQQATFETIEDVRQINQAENKLWMQQPAATYEPLSEKEITTELVASALHLNPIGDVVREPVIGSTGNWFLLVQVASAQVLQNLQPDLESIATLSDQLHVIGFYVFASESIKEPVLARMFAPAYGIPEEAATGTAAGPLACFLHDFLKNDQKTIQIKQEMHAAAEKVTGTLFVNLIKQKEKLTEIWVGGEATVDKEAPLPPEFNKD